MLARCSCPDGERGRGVEEPASRRQRRMLYNRSGSDGGGGGGGGSLDERLENGDRGVGGAWIGVDRQTGMEGKMMQVVRR